jgi:histidine ammonia-lyase
VSDVRIGAAGLTIEDVVRVAHGAGLALDDADPAFRGRIAASAAHLQARLAGGDVVYGVNTGFGDSCVNAVASEHVTAMPLNLVRFHGCGTGALLGPVEAAAVVAVRAGGAGPRVVGGAAGRARAAVRAGRRGACCRRSRRRGRWGRAGT